LFFAISGSRIVDEQHRFGVHQRLALGQKGAAADILVMTATPIPRTLVLTYFGDMDVSNLREKPAGREQVATRALPIERVDELIARLKRAIHEGAAPFGSALSWKRAKRSTPPPRKNAFVRLQEVFGDNVGLVHGK